MFTITKLLTASVMAATAAAALDDNSTKTPDPPSIVPSHGYWSNATCYWDLYADDRQLPVPTVPPFKFGGAMNVKLCLDFCEVSGHTFAGLEFGQECYCGDNRPDQHWVQRPDDGSAQTANCVKYACTGDAKQACGGEQSLLVYELNRPKHNNNIFTTVNKNIYTTALAN